MEFIKQNIYLVILAAVSGSLLLADILRGAGASAGLSATEATLLINRENALILDVREAAEFATGHIANARNIPLDELEKRVGELGRNKKKPVLLVCESGARSSKAMEVLSKAGFEKTANLAGGVALWKKDGLPLVKA